MSPVNKTSSIKKLFSQFGVEELDWAAQSPDLNPVQHRWDELELDSLTCFRVTGFHLQLTRN